MVEHPEREDCYIARLLVRRVAPKDSRKYYLDVENVHGTDRYAVALTVKGKLCRTFSTEIDILRVRKREKERKRAREREKERRREREK